jgi:hypothetical protein
LKPLNGEVSMNGGANKHGTVSKELVKGAMLLAPEQNTEVTTAFGTVHIAQNSVALIVCTDLGLAVYNLDDKHLGAVRVSANGESIALAPGRMLAITSKAVGGFEQVNPAQFVGYRGITSRELNGNLKAFQAEFNHLSILAGLEPLRSMFKSTDASKRKLGAHILKTSLALSAMSSTKAPFQLMAPPAVTAMK